MDANVTAVIIGIIAASPGLIALYVQQRKDDRRAPLEDAATAAEIVAQYSAEIKQLRAELKDVRAQMDDMEKRLAEQDAVMDEWARGIDRLCGQLTAHELTPVWRPKTTRKAAD
jgi:capsule polysaccharide export protein KpsE/RkpR